MNAHTAVSAGDLSGGDQVASVCDFRVICHLGPLVTLRAAWPAVTLSLQLPVALSGRRVNKDVCRGAGAAALLCFSRPGWDCGVETARG